MKKPVNGLRQWLSLVKYDAQQAASWFAELPIERSLEIAERMGPEFIASLVDRLQSDASANLMRRLSADFRSRVLERLTEEKAGLIRELLSYPLETAGALMAKEFLSVPVGATLGQVLESLRVVPKDRKGKISYIYAVDENRRLEGVIQIRDLIFYPPSKRVREILRSPVVQVETGMSQMDVARLFQRHRYLGLPVVDRSQRLVGIISADNVLRVFENEAEDEIAKIVGTGVDEMRDPSMRRILRLRIPWLFFSIASGLVCAVLQHHFQLSIANIAVLFLFVPVVLGLSESIGVQGATIIVRSMALGHSRFKDLGSLLVKELAAGSVIALVCGAIVGTAAGFWRADHRLGTALTVSMMLAMVGSAAVGLFLPILFKKLKADPAVASGPIVLALCDILTLAIYFSLSGLILK